MLNRRIVMLLFNMVGYISSRIIDWYICWSSHFSRLSEYLLQHLAPYSWVWFRLTKSSEGSNLKFWSSNLTFGVCFYCAIFFAAWINCWSDYYLKKLHQLFYRFVDHATIIATGHSERSSIMIIENRTVKVMILESSTCCHMSVNRWYSCSSHGYIWHSRIIAVVHRKAGVVN